MTGTSVLGLKYKDGVLIAADTAGNETALILLGYDFTSQLCELKSVPGSAKGLFRHCEILLRIGGCVGLS